MVAIYGVKITCSHEWESERHTSKQRTKRMELKIEMPMSMVCEQNTMGLYTTPHLYAYVVLRTPYAQHIRSHTRSLADLLAHSVRENCHGISINSKIRGDDLIIFYSISTLPSILFTPLSQMLIVRHSTASTPYPIRQFHRLYMLCYVTNYRMYKLHINWLNW